MDSEWIHDGFVIEEEHAVEWVHELSLFKSDRLLISDIHVVYSVRCD